MKQRVKRYHPKSSQHASITLEINDSLMSGQLVDISLAGASFLFVGDVGSESLEDEIGRASLKIKNKEFELGKVIVTRQSESPPSHLLGFADPSNISDPGKTIIALKTLHDHIPIEQFVRYLESDGSSPYEFELAHGKFTLADFNKPIRNDDILEKTKLILKMQDAWKKKHSYQYERYRMPSKGGRVSLDLPRLNNRNDYLSFGSNDYLGLGSHPEVIASAKDALDKYGVGSTGSAVSSGLTIEHRKLNSLIANIFERESCLLFNSGYTANVGALSALCREGDLVIYDKIAHTSIQDGIIFALANGATCIPFKHNDMKHLEDLLSEHRENYSGCLIVTEGIFSMDGDIADLAKIVPLAKKYNARTYLDSAHDFGVIGENGLGAAEYHNVLNDIDIIMGTFSKIGGSIGGFIVGSVEVIEYLRMISRPHIFSVSIPPSVAACAHKAISLFWEDKTHLKKLKSNIKTFVRGLRELGVPIKASHQSSICPVLVGDEEKLEQMTKILYENGIWSTPVVFPVVSRDRCRFRFTVTASHSQSDLDYALIVLKMAIKEVNLVFKMAEKSSLPQSVSTDKKR